MSDPRFPIGKFSFPASVSLVRPDGVHRRYRSSSRERCETAVAGLSAQQLDTPYREGGWTVRQVTHHMPDSHMNAYVRYKLTLTEDEPTIKPYAEDRWAQLADTQSTPIEVSLADAGVAARALGAVASFAQSRGLEAAISPSGSWRAFA